MDRIHCMVLALCCLITFGNYFNYDLPGSLLDDFNTTLAENDSSKLGLMYSFYSFPNVVQPFFGGVLIDKVLGIRKAGVLLLFGLGFLQGVVISSFLVTSGCSIVALAAGLAPYVSSSTSFYIAILGRFVFGLGGEVIAVCQNSFCAKWFRGSDLVAAFAISLSCARIGSAVNFAIEPRISHEWGFFSACLVGSLTCVFSFLLAIVLALFDLRYEHILENDSILDATVQNLENDEYMIEETLLGNDNEQANITLRSASEDAADDMVYDVPLAELLSDEAEVDSGQPDGAVKSKSNILLEIAGPIEVLIYLICVFFYVGVFTFVSIGVKFFTDTYPNTNSVSAGVLVSLPYTVSAIVSPILGFIMDRVGRSGWFVCLACAFLCAIHGCFAFFPQLVSPSLMMIWMGFAYSICAASLWPMIAIVVKSRNVAAAYGLMMSVQNTGLAIAPIVINRHIPNFAFIETIFTVLAFFALLCSLSLYYFDTRYAASTLFGNAKSVKLLDSAESTYAVANSNPFLLHPRFLSDATESTRRAMEPKTPHRIRLQYFRKLRIQLNI